MKNASKYLPGIVAVLVLSGLLLGALSLIQPQRGAAATDPAFEQGTSYPMPITEVSVTAKPIITSVSATPALVPTVIEAATPMTMEGMTPLWFTPEALTATPSLAGSVIHDAFNKFSVTLPAGWYAYPPADFSGLAALTYVSNYDEVVYQSQPGFGIYAQIQVLALEDGQTFDEWVAKLRHDSTSADNGAGGIELGPIQPQRLGTYEGVSFTAHDMNDPRAKPMQMIALRPDDHIVIGILVLPNDSPSFAEILTILDTLTLDPLTTP